MEFLSASLVLNIIIAILLVATIAYVARLSIYLKAFKNNRDELKLIIAQLSTQITKAEQSVEGLHVAADDAGQDLQSRLNKANAMFDELDIVVKTGDALANRLEDLAIKNRKIIDGGESYLSDLVRATKKETYDNRVENLVRHVEKTPAPDAGFAIRDDNTDDQDGFTLDDNEVLSEAERDLYDALQESKKSRRGKV
jgi:uncharacterized protein YoxC